MVELTIDELGGLGALGPLGILRGAGGPAGPGGLGGPAGLGGRAVTRPPTAAKAAKRESNNMMPKEAN